jgi:uncharacterized membrane protein (UPF0127 family)
MSYPVGVFKKGADEGLVLVARWCESFFCRLRGLMFRRELPGGMGLILVERREGITNTTIHMFAVPFAIGVLWVNSAGEVVDKIVAKPWRVYAPAKPALYIVEGSPSIVDGVNIGEEIEFRKVDET